MLKIYIYFLFKETRTVYLSLRIVQSCLFGFSFICKVNVVFRLALKIALSVNFLHWVRHWRFHLPPLKNEIKCKIISQFFSIVIRVTFEHQNTLQQLNWINLTIYIQYKDNTNMTEDVWIGVGRLKFKLMITY